MSRENLEKFVESVYSDERLRRTLLEDADSEDDIIERAVSAASIQGLDFSREELRTWINEQREAAEAGELTDLELESVAGGKSYKSTEGDRWDQNVNIRDNNVS